MNVTAARWLDAGHTTIQAVIKGRTLCVPNDMANHERREIAEWVAAGSAIAEYVPDPE